MTTITTIIRSLRRAIHGTTTQPSRQVKPHLGTRMQMLMILGGAAR